MTRSASPKVGAYAGLAAFALVAGLVLGRPELAVVAAPFALLLVVGLALAREPRLRLTVDVERERALEGDEVVVRVEVELADAVERLELLLDLPEGLQVVGRPNPLGLRVRRNEERALDFRVACTRWGGYVVGDVVVRARDLLGFFVFEQRIRPRFPLRVYPRPEELRRLLPPRETQASSGNQVSRGKGEGIEFADLRPFAAGDRVRRINWRASARRNALWVNESHPERNTDVLLFLDTFADVRGDAEGTLDLTVRAAATLAGRYLERKDRVGVVSFGGVLRWLLPSSGLTQLYRILDSLIDTEVTLSYAWKDVDVIPRRTLPPKALILALTPLLDERAVGTLLDLRARGFDLAVVEVSPVPFAESAPGEPAELARRLWLMKREALRSSYEQVGVPVVEWREGAPLAAALEEVASFRRQAGTVRA